MKRFQEFFSDAAIADALARLRVGTARRRHAAHFLWEISSSAPEPALDVTGPVDHLLPPRRQWRRPGYETRQNQSADNVYSRAITRTVLGFLASGRIKEVEWGRQFLAFTREVRSIMESGEPIHLHKPRIIPLRKDGGRGEYRAMAMYDHVVDRIVIGQTAKYLRACLDYLFADNSYAFRLSGELSYHKAIENLTDYAARFAGRPLYVAECDIRKCYDSLCHDVVRKAIERACSRAAADGIVVDPAAMRVFESYLDSYTFIETALPGADEWFRLHKRQGSIGGLPEAALRKVHGDTVSHRLGIPQGGALSTLIANLVLDEADRRILDEQHDTDLFYARFCDDMIVIHPDQTACHAALSRYLDAATQLKLVVHPPRRVARYGEAYYAGKSKLPFKWGDPSRGKGFIPWISFVGYQVRFDGQLRVRKTSIEKHRTKQLQEVGRVLNLLKHGGTHLRVSGAAVLWRLRHRLASMSVGRERIRKPGNLVSTPCWMEAFRLVRANIYSVSQMRGLDRSRDRQVSRLKRRMGALGIETMPKALPQPRDGEAKNRQWKFIGKPYSYVAFLTRVKDVVIRFNDHSRIAYFE